MTCPNCGSTRHEFLLIDCTLAGEARERVRYCFDCKKEASHPLSGYQPFMLVRMNLPADVLHAALASRRYVVDRRASYPIEERLADLGIHTTHCAECLGETPKQLKPN